MKIICRSKHIVLQIFKRAIIWRGLCDSAHQRTRDFASFAGYWKILLNSVQVFGCYLGFSQSNIFCYVFTSKRILLDHPMSSKCVAWFYWCWSAIQLSNAIQYVQCNTSIFSKLWLLTINLYHIAVKFTSNRVFDVVIHWE